MKFWLVWIGMAAVGALAACGSTGQSVDFDNDGASDSSDCAPADPSVYPGALEACDTTDSDCDGDLVDGFGNMDGDALPDCIDPDGDGDGFDAKDDCDDENPSTFPGAEEIQDGREGLGDLALDPRQCEGTCASLSLVEEVQSQTQIGG